MIEISKKALELFEKHDPEAHQKIMQWKAQGKVRIVERSVIRCPTRSVL
ncbi:MAG: hypothetical protein WC683_15740 [bacterium]